MLALSQQATLETRQAKHEPRSLAEQRHAWRTQAVEVLGSQRALTAMIADVTNQAVAQQVAITDNWVGEQAAAVIATVAEARATWTVNHVRAEAQRVLRYADHPGGPRAGRPHRGGRSLRAQHRLDHTRRHREKRARRRCAAATVPASTPATTPPSTPAPRSWPPSGASWPPPHCATAAPSTTPASVWRWPNTNANHGPRAQRRTGRPGARHGHLRSPRPARARPGRHRQNHRDGRPGRRLAQRGGTVIGLAPTAGAAEVLGQDLGAPTDTIAKLVQLTETRGGQPAPADDPARKWFDAIDSGTLLIVDEAGMASTADLDTVIAHALARGASVRLIGDDQQLASISAGGVLRDLADRHETVT